MSSLESLMQQAKEALNAPKRRHKEDLDLCELTDILVVFPKEELEACIEALYYTLEHSTSSDFNNGVRRAMVNAIKRLDDQ
ncbi:hypothetical protein D1872_51620 [compost metagenome]